MPACFLPVAMRDLRAIIHAEIYCTADYDEGAWHLGHEAGAVMAIGGDAFVLFVADFTMF